MAKKKDNKSKPLKQITDPLGIPQTQQRGWFGKAKEAAKGGAGDTVGFGSLGYGVNWSKVDFGKAALSKKMNNEEGGWAARKRCEKDGGTWNYQTKKCEGIETETETPTNNDVPVDKSMLGEPCNCEGTETEGKYVENASGEIVCECIDTKSTKSSDEDCNCDNFDPELSDENDPCYEKCAGTGDDEVNEQEEKCPGSLLDPPTHYWDDIGKKCVDRDDMKSNEDEGSCEGKEEEKEMCAAGDYGDGMVWNNDTCECEKDPNKGSGSDIKPKKDDTKPKQNDQDLNLEAKKGDKDDLLKNDIENMRVSELNQGLDMNRLTPNSGKQLNKNLAALSDPETHSGNINGASGKIFEGVNANDYTSIALGGGEIKNKKQQYSFKRGKLTGQTNSGAMWVDLDDGDKKRRKRFNWSFEITGKGEISFNKMTGYSQEVWGNIIGGLRKDGNKGIGVDLEKGKATMTKQEWDKFTKVYNKKIEELIKRRDRFAKDHANNEDSVWWANNSFEPWERDLLRMHAQGFFANTFGKEEPPTKFKNPINYGTPTFVSPFKRRDRSYLRVRENWMPTPMKHGTFEDFQYGRNGHNPDTMSAKHEDWHLKQSGESPNNYNSPFHQEEQMQQPTNIWEKIQAYGKDMDKRIDKFIQHTNYDPATDKPINSFQNQTWVGIITEWLQGQKQVMIDAGNNNDKQAQQNVSTAVNQLIQDVTTYSGKFLDWIDRNSGDQAEGNAGGSVTSNGSRKDEKFIGNITFMGDQNTTIGIGDDGKIGIKSYGLEDVKYVEDLDTDVFAKDDAGYQMFLEASGQLQKDAESGKPLNSSIVEGHADNLLKNEDSILSWAFDSMYGQSWIQDYVQANPNADVDMFMPESPSFDIDYLTDELHGWLTSKLTEAYEKNKPAQPEQKGEAAQGIMNETLANVEQEKENKEGVYAEEGAEQPAMQPQGMPAPQESPMMYRSPRRAREILKKLNKINR
tara:strand:- start:353 stop:3250 length:2898 start_codon:yes stop_codon:yes gene_type:complete